MPSTLHKTPLYRTMVVIINLAKQRIAFVRHASLLSSLTKGAYTIIRITTFYSQYYVTLKRPA